MTDREKFNSLRNTIEKSWIFKMKASRDFPNSVLRVEARMLEDVMKWIDELLEGSSEGELEELSEKSALECNDWKEACKKEFYNSNIWTSGSTQETYTRGFRAGQYWRQQIDKKTDKK